MKKHIGTIIAAAGLAVIGASIATSSMNCHGKDYITGTLIEKSDNCDRLYAHIVTDERARHHCDYSIQVKSELSSFKKQPDEPAYTIGILDTLGAEQLYNKLEVGAKVKFLKDSSRWVTAFRRGGYGVVSPTSIEVLEE